MAVDSDFIREAVNRHNNDEDDFEIYNLQGTSAVNNTISSIYNPHDSPYPPITIEGDDIIFYRASEAYLGTEGEVREIVTKRTGIDNIDAISYYDPDDPMQLEGFANRHEK